jgi:gliding motility-associated lipoprotein GldD
MKINTTWVVLLAIASMAACNGEVPTPKPRAFPRVEYPERKYSVFNQPDCPFTFEYPSYAEIQPKQDHACWFDLYMPTLKARVHCSYVPIRNRAEYDELVSDAYLIATKINARANYMEENLIRNPQDIAGMVLKWTGPAASPMHFYLTDTTRHFFKAALYFEAEVRPDSLAPISAFVQEDINKMIQSFAWKNE